jgi:glucokinase
MDAAQPFELCRGERTCAIGLDVGGSKIAAGIVTPAGHVFLRRIVPTCAERPGADVLADVVGLAEELAEEVGRLGLELLGVGVGVAELVDPLGKITSAHTIRWRELSIRERFAHLGRVVVEADVRAAALAEACYGAGRAFRLWAYVTVGTGISCCLIQDGQPYAGARGNALVLGSGPLSARCTVCGAEIESILEDVASGPALVARYNQRRTGRAQRGEDVMAALDAGDPWAAEVVRTAGEALGNSVGLLVHVLDPEAVIVGGGLGHGGGLYWSSFVDATRRHIWADATRQIPILPAALGNDAGLIGAAAQVWQRGVASGEWGGGVFTGG